MSNPLFYYLAQHGPWKHHVVVGNIQVSEAWDWLVDSGYNEGVDWESLDMVTFGNRLVQIIFFNDPSIASYVKLKWGGK